MDRRLERIGSIGCADKPTRFELVKEMGLAKCRRRWRNRITIMGKVKLSTSIQ